MKCSVNMFLMITIFVISICPCMSFAQTGVANKVVHPKNQYEGLTDFINGRLESVHKDVWNVEGIDFLISNDTVFLNMNGEEISKNTISVGDMIRVTFAPEENDRVLEVELQGNGRKLQKRSTAGMRRDRLKRHEVIVLKNGVYTNERH